MVLSNS